MYERLLASAAETTANHLDAGLELGADISTAALRQAALNGYTSSASIFAELAAQAPDNAGFRRDFSLSMARRARALETLGQRSEALTMYRIALTTAEELTRLDASNTVWADDLVYYKERIARLEEARAAEDKHNNN